MQQQTKSSEELSSGGKPGGIGLSKYKPIAGRFKFECAIAGI